MIAYTPPPVELAVHEVKRQAESVRSLGVEVMAPPFSAVMDGNAQDDDAVSVNEEVHDVEMD